MRRTSHSQHAILAILRFFFKKKTSGPDPDQNLQGSEIYVTPFIFAGDGSHQHATIGRRGSPLMEAFHFLSCSPSVCVSVSNSILRGVFLEDCRVPRTAMAADQPWATRWQFVAQVVLFCIFTGDLPAVTLFCIFRKFTGDFPVCDPASYAHFWPACTSSVVLHLHGRLASCDPAGSGGSLLRSSARTCAC